MSGFLEGKACIVTGASSGIGRAIATCLGKEGADLWLVGRNAEQLAATAGQVQESGGRGEVHCVVLDIAEPPALGRLVEEVAAHHPYLFCLVNNAGVMYPEALIDIEDDRLEEMFNVDLFAPIAGCRAAIAAMRRHGKPGQLINISSQASQEDRYGGYSVVKSALEHAGRCMRRELESDDIRITNICPGAFSTNLARGLKAEARQKFAENIANTGLDLEGPEAARIFADPERIGELVSYVLRQPIELNIDFISIRPAVALQI